MLLYVMGQKVFYENLIQGLRARRTVDEESMVPA
jgi:hypothetical protein